MSDAFSRFFTFERSLGPGLVKFAYYVLLALFIVATVIAMIAAFIGMFTEGFWSNLFAFLVVLPVRFVIAVILLRVATELVLAVLSIDDSLRSAGLADGRAGSAEDATGRLRANEAAADRSFSASQTGVAPAPRTTVTTPQEEDASSGAARSTIKAANESPASARGGASARKEDDPKT